MHSASEVFVIRLSPHQDLKQYLLKFALEQKIQAGIVLSCVGSLEQYHLRFANQKTGRKKQGHFEILSLTGTLSSTSCHLHLAVADETGLTTGGHLLDDNFIYTTAEIAIAELTDLTFERVVDPAYGYSELAIRPRTKPGR